MATNPIFSPISVRANTICYELLLTANTPISHHDPAVTDKSNRTLFNRQKQLAAANGTILPVDQQLIDDLAQMHLVPADIADIFADVTFTEFIATSLTRLFIDFYNSADGEGLFAGMERYTHLETRLRMAAICAPTLRGWWDRLCDTMQVSIHGGDADLQLFRLLAVPVSLQQAVLRSLATEHRSIVALARLWHSTSKLVNERYAVAIGKAPIDKLIELHWDAAALTPGSTEAQIIEVPTVTGNSLRHQVVREPAWLHLCQHLGLEENTPGRGPVPPGVEAIFYNGGNIAAGAKQPSNVFGLAWRTRELYPSLDLLGGVTDSFDLGESRLAVSGWLVCAENRAALEGSPAHDLPAASISAFDLLDDVTLTRQAGIIGVGQMIFSFEVLAPGTQILCRLSLSPYTRSMTHGALLAALETFLTNGAVVGGQGARGFGHCRGKILVQPPNTADLRQEYEVYLAENKDTLRAGLCDGTLGTGHRILT